MNDQMIVTDYFTAAKSRQGFQAAKRRKIVADGGTLLQNGSKEPFDVSFLSASVDKPIFKGTPSAASSRTKQTRTTSRARNSKNRTTRRDTVAKKSMSEGVSSEVTSTVDDHDLDRPRKQSQKANLTTVASQSQKAEIGERSEKEAREGCDGQEPCPEDKMSVDSCTKPNVVAQQRSGLKIHPWISEQAKVVLATSRGRRALEKSLGRNLSKSGLTSKKNILKPEPEEKKEVLIPKRSVHSAKPKPKVPRLHQSISASSQDLPTTKEER